MEIKLEENYSSDFESVIILIIITGVLIYYVIKMNFKKKDSSPPPIHCSGDGHFSSILYYLSKGQLSKYYAKCFGNKKPNTNNIDSAYSQHGKKLQDTQGRMNSLTDTTKSITGVFSNMISGIYSLIENVIIKIQKELLTTKSIIEKFSGIVLTLLYMTMGGIDTGKSFINGPVYKQIKNVGKLAEKFCFQKNTLIEMNDGTYKKIKNIKINDILKGDSRVLCKLKILNVNNEPFYKIGDVMVTGGHLILDDMKNKFVCVSDFDNSVKTDKIDNIVYNLITSNQLIKIGNYTFWDYDD